MRYLKAVCPDGNAITTAAMESIVTVLLQKILTEYKAFPRGPCGVIMQGVVEKYRYVRALILRLVAYGNRDNHIGNAICRATFRRWLSKTIEFAGDERCLPIF